MSELEEQVRDAIQEADALSVTLAAIHDSIEGGGPYADDVRDYVDRALNFLDVVQSALDSALSVIDEAKEEGSNG